MTDRRAVDLLSELLKLSLEPEDLDPGARRILAEVWEQRERREDTDR